MKDSPTSKCIRCNTCDGFPCLLGAKSDAQVVAVDPALRHPNVTLMVDSYVERLETTPSGREVIGSWSTATASREEFSGDLVVVSAGAINSAALLLRSANDRHPRGLANGSDVVGRHYMGHINSVLMAISKCPNPTVFQKTLSVNDFYFGSDEFAVSHGPHLLRRQAGRRDARKPERPRSRPGFTLEIMANHSLDFWLTSEDLPDPNNRVTLDRDGNIVLNYKPNNEEGHKRLIAKLKDLMKQQTQCPMHGHECHQGLFARNLFVGQTHSACRRRPSERNDSLRERSADLGARCQLQGARSGQPVRRRWQLLPVQRRRESCAHDHGECAARRRSHDREDDVTCCGVPSSPSYSSRRVWVLPRTASDLVRVDSIGITVSDLDRSVEFYTRVLSFEKVSESEADGDAYEHLKGVFGRQASEPHGCGWATSSSSSLSTLRRQADRGRRIRTATIGGSSTSRSSSATWTARTLACVENKVQHASSGPQRLPDWNKNAGGIHAFYFRDPDGHSLEVLAFPPDKGDPKWHRPTNQLFLGIDHTAIVISDTDASLRFYRDALGLHDGWRERELRARTGAPQQRLRRSPAHYVFAGCLRTGQSSFWNILHRETVGLILPMQSRTTWSMWKPGSSGPPSASPRESCAIVGWLSFLPGSSTCLGLVAAKSHSWCAILMGMPSVSLRNDMAGINTRSGWITWMRSS